MSPDPLPDRWQTRDLPALFAIARRLDAGELVVDDQALADELGIGQPEAARAIVALGEAGYVDAGSNRMMSGDVFASAHQLNERGRRTVGLWPDQDQAADALVELLTQAADTTEDEDDAGALRKAGRLLRSVPSAVVADIAAALIRQQTGL